MGDLGLQVRRQVDNVNSTKRAFLHADTTPNTESFRNECDPRVRCDFDTEFTGPHNGARLFTLLTTFLITHQQEASGKKNAGNGPHFWLALIWVSI